jgi:integrase
MTTESVEPAAAPLDVIEIVQLPAIILPAASAVTIPMPDMLLVPALIADAGDAASWRYIDYFTSNIRNPNTRRASARACFTFFAWCEERGLSLTVIRPFDVISYIVSRQQTHSTPVVKQQLAAIRMLFNGLITGQIVPSNPVAAVRGPKHVVKTGKTPVLDGKEWRKLLDAIPTNTVRDLRDRALIATLTYSFARIGPALKMKVEDFRPKGAGWQGWQVRLHEKGGKEHAMPCHHALAEALRAYIDAAGIAEDRKGYTVPHVARPQSDGSVGSIHEAAGCLADDPPARGGHWHSRADRQSFASRHWDHRLSLQWRCFGAWSEDGGA